MARFRSIPLALCLLASIVSTARASQADQTAAAPTSQAPARAAAASPATRGLVVDEQGAPVARARVRVLNRDGAEVASGFTDERGRFSVFAPACATCRIEAHLPGFERAAADSDPAVEVRLTLRVAPIGEHVVVTPNRGDTPLSQVGTAVTVIDRGDIDRRGAPLVAELLRSTPGVTVVQSGGAGTVTSLFVRGGESNYNKVLIDGIPINEPGGTFNFGHLSTAGLERIEIVRGAQSALFGSDAMSSVVHLISARGRSGQAASGSARLDAGAYGTRRVEADVRGGVRAWDYSFTAGRLDSDNRVPNNALSSTTFALTTGGPLTGALALRAIARFARHQVGTPGQTAFGRPDLDAFFDRDDVVGGVSLEHHGGARWRQEAVFAVNQSTQLSANRREDPPFTPAFDGRTAPFEFFDFLYESRNTLRRFTAGYKVDARFGAPRALGDLQIVTAAFDWDGERATLRDVMAGTALDATRDNAGLTVQHQILADRVFTTAGLRVEHNASFGTAAVPRASAAILVRRSDGTLGSTTLRVTAGLGVKEPTVLQSFSQSPFFLGNPDLEPERSRSADISIEQRLFGRRGKVEATWFDSVYRNQISTRTLSFSPFRAQYFNIGRTRARGLELSIDAAPVAGLRLRGGYTLVASRIVESASPGSAAFEEGAWTFRRPRHSGFFEGAWTHGRLGLDLSGVFSGRRVDSDFSSLEPAILESNPPAVWTLAGRYAITRRLELQVRIDNLTDAEYMEPLGYLAWRRAVHGGVRVRF